MISVLHASFRAAAAAAVGRRPATTLAGQSTSRQGDRFVHPPLESIQIHSSAHMLLTKFLLQQNKQQRRCLSSRGNSRDPVLPNNSLEHDRHTGYLTHVVGYTSSE